MATPSFGFPFGCRFSSPLHTCLRPVQTNVPGIYDRPPEEAGAQLLRSIAVHTDGSWHVEGDVELAVSATDATGTWRGI